jgi:pimeloyl-ACP methyl ester carboxylesterase
VYPISFNADYEVERNRLTTFFRPLVAIPWILWGYLYGIAGLVVVVIAWFAVLFTKRYPEGMYNFVGNYLRFQARVAGFVMLLTDELPPFGGGERDDYPIQLDYAPPQPEYRRSRTFFKYVLILPLQLLMYGVVFLAFNAAFITWFRILFTGKQSITMHDALELSLAYAMRVNSFSYVMTEAHPRLLEVEADEPPPGAPGMLYSGENPELLPPATATATQPPPEPPPPPAPEPPTTQQPPTA